MNRTVTPTLNAQRTGFHDTLTLPSVDVLHAPAVAPASAREPGPAGTPVARGRADSRVARSQTLLVEAAATADPIERKRLQDEVVVLHLGLARAIASRYRGRGIADDDLEQAAATALLKAARGFDPSLGAEFLSYAVVTMKGEVKRQFRDHGWMVRPPRPIQKLQVDVTRAQGELTQQLGRSPRVAEVATYLGESVEHVVEALSADGCYTPSSLDVPVGADGSVPLGELLAGGDTGLGEAEARVVLGPAMRTLSEVERQIVFLRFFEQHTQAQIALRVGVSQMQVSRILARVLLRLRAQLA